MSSSAPAPAPVAAATSAIASVTITDEVTPAVASSSSSSSSTPAPIAGAAAPGGSAAVLGGGKGWEVASVPEGADPLDYVNMAKLAADNASLPKTKEGIEEFLNTMPLTAEVMPEAKDMNTEFAGIQCLIDETPLDARAENFKDSGNEAYKLSLRMTKDHKEGMAKRAAIVAEREKAGLPAPVLTEKEQKEDKYELDHLNKLVDSARKRLVDAIEYYTQALDVEKADPTQKITNHLKAHIYSNRALVHLTMQNYGRAQADCDEALKLEPKHAKASYRGATAALAVGTPKLEKARAYIASGRVHDPKRLKIDWQFRAEQKSMDDLEARVVAIEAKELAKQEAKKAEQAAKAKKADAYTDAMTLALASRGVKLGPLVFDFARSAYAEQSKEGGGALPRPLLYPPPPYTASTTLGWPLLILYPEVLQSDFVQECREDHCLEDHLAQMFPPNTDYAPWDEKKQYTLSNLSVWIDVRGPNIPHDSTPADDQAARMLVNPRHSLRNVLSNPKLQKKGYLVPGIPTFIVLPKQ